MKLAEIRSRFLEYFKNNEHTIVSSSTLVPVNDETLLFTNAGMVPFKDVFLGREQRPYVRATSSQRCVRAGGKHNDLENVGYTARHHTFFEMLGNFSFGDYFKVEAIEFAWAFLTKELKIPEERLWVTVFEEDKEAEDIWLNHMKVDPKRFSRCGEKDNFWAMGDTGPCGPCTEIFYDHGPDVPGGPPGSPDEDADRYIEIWNLVFMQYNRAPDGTLAPLPKPSVDTGMGLERIAAVMQGVHSNYEVDLFQQLIKAAASILEVKDLSQQSLRVLADHIRACAFLIADDVLPSNEGRGYVLRRIIRRAIRHGHKLGGQEVFFHKLVAPLAQEMGDAYPELKDKVAHIEKILQKEEEQFLKTLDQGLKILEQDLSNLKSTTIPGEIIFKLYDTYGFPMDLTRDIAREKGLHIDEAGFEHEMAEQRQRARDASQFSADYHSVPENLGTSDFSGYHAMEDAGVITAIIKEGEKVNTLNPGESGAIVLDNTPFYAESGGQVGDTGTIRLNSAVFTVQDTKKSTDAHLHYGELNHGPLKVGDHIVASVDKTKRRAIMLNHSATHLLHAALRHILGDHVTQKGSLVDADRLRFDFSHYEALTPEILDEIEVSVNAQIRENSVAETDIMDMEEATASGAMALFGEKYGEKVRVLRMGGDFSVELCGGTHVNRTGEIGLMVITSETGIAAGVRRIEAITGEKALNWLKAADTTLKSIMAELKADRSNVHAKLNQLSSNVKKLERQNQQLNLKLASSSGADLSQEATEISGVKVIAKKLPAGDPGMLRNLVDDLKNKLGSGVIVLATVNDDKVSLIAGVTKDYSNQFKAGELVNFVAQQVGGKGGGRPDMAQAGGNKPAEVDKALASVLDWVRSKT